MNMDLSCGFKTLVCVAFSKFYILFLKTRVDTDQLASNEAS